MCPAPRRPLALPLTEWSGANAQMEIGVHASDFPQHSALFKEQRWAADDCVSDVALQPVQAAEYPFASSTATGLDAALMHKADNGAIDNVPTYGEDSSAPYSVDNWARCGADSSYPYGAGGPAMYEDDTYMYGDGTCMYGTGISYMNSAGNLGACATDITAGTMIGCGSSPSRDTTIERYSTTTTTPIITPGNRSRFDSNGSAADTSNYTANGPVDHESTAAESPSESLLFGRVAPANTHPQGLNAESMSIMNMLTWQEAGGLMSSEQLYLLLKSEAGPDAI